MNNPSVPPPSTNPNAQGDSSKRVVAGVTGILLGALGIHKFVMGYTVEGLIMLGISLVGGLITCGVASMVVGIIGLIEGIVYLTKTEDEFNQMYVKNKRGWF